MKKRIYNLLSVSKKIGDASWWTDILIITLIVLNVVAIILESFEELRTAFSLHFYYFEVFTITLFSIEYLLRLWTADLNKQFSKPLGNLRYLLTPMAIIDLLSVLPFFLPFMGIDLRFIRALRIMKVFRLFKIARYMSALSLISNVFNRKRDELILSLIFTVFLLLITSTIMYYVENEAQPESFSNIPETMWWGIATLTTVGYGDVYPITPMGKFLGGMIALIGIGLFALPTGILASGFTEELAKTRVHSNRCPTCGQEIKKPDHAKE